MALLCPQCGAVLTEGAASCSRCNTPLARSQAAPIAAEARWVKVEPQLRCRLCGLLTPITPMHASDVVRCERCQRDQAFDPSVWAKVMDVARGALRSQAEVEGEAVIDDDLPRKVGVALHVSSIVDDPPQQPEGARQYIPASDYRGSMRAGWFLLAKDADKDGVAPSPSSAEEKEEAARDKRGLARSGVLLVIECAAMIAAVVIWRGTGGLRSEFWIPFGIGLLLNGIWGWACFSLAQRPKETDAWIYYVMALLPQAAWIIVSLWMAGWEAS